MGIFDENSPTTSLFLLCLIPVYCALANRVLYRGICLLACILWGRRGRLDSWTAGRGRSDAQSTSILYYNQIYQFIRSRFIAHTNTFQVECTSPGFHSKNFGHLILVSCISAILGRKERVSFRCGNETLEVRPRSLCLAALSATCLTVGMKTSLSISRQTSIRYRWPYRRNKQSITYYPIRVPSHLLTTQNYSTNSMELTVNALQNSQVPESQEPNSLTDELALLTRDELPFFLPMPKDGDDLETIARKMQSLASMISSGRNLSVGIGHVSSPKQKQTAEGFARERMTSPETTQYEAWKVGIIQLPEFDWYNNQAHVPPEAMRAFSRRAIAVDIIWQRRGMAPEHAAWVTINMPFLLPLVKAVTKILEAEEHWQRTQRHARLTDRDIAEIEMLQLVNAAAEQNVTRVRERLRTLIDSIHRSQAVLKDRISMLEN